MKQRERYWPLSSKLNSRKISKLSKTRRQIHLEYLQDSFKIVLLCLTKTNLVSEED